MKSLKLKEFETLNFAIEVDYKLKKGMHIMTHHEIREERMFKSDMQFEITFPNGEIERRYITRKRLKEINNIKFRVIREKLYD